MKTRTILLSLLGVAVYIILASFNSKMMKDNPPDKKHGPEKAIVTQPAEQQAAAPPPPRVLEAVPPQPAEPGPPAAAAVRTPAPALQIVTPEATSDAAEFETLRADLARKDQQISQLLDAQEAVAAKYQQLMAQYEQVKATTATDRETSLAQATEQLDVLAADRTRLAQELQAAKATAEELKAALSKAQLAGTETDKKAGDTEGQLKTLEQRVQQQADEIGLLKSQLSENASQLEAAKTALNKAELKAEAMLRFGQTKEKQLLPLEELNLNMEKELKQKIDSLTEADKTIDRLQQEVATHAQAATALQTNLDEQVKKIEQAGAETAAEKQRMSQQVAILTEAEAAARNEIGRLKTEAESGQRSVRELESGLALAQSMLSENEKKLANALAERDARQQELGAQQAALTGRETALEALQTQCADHAAAITSLNEEKLILSGKLETAALAEKELVETKNALEQKTAALAEIQGKLNSLPALQARMSEAEVKAASLSQALDEKNLALSDTLAKLDTLPALQTQVTEGQAKTSELSRVIEEKSAALVAAVKQAEELTALKAQLTEAQAKNAELTAASNTQSQAITALEAEKTSLSGQVASLQALSEELKTLKASFQEKTTALAATEEEINKLTAVAGQVKALEATLAENRTALTALQAFKTEAEQKLTGSESALHAAKQTLAASSQKTSSLETELTAALAKISEFDKALQQKKEEDIVPNLQQQIATLRDQVVQGETALQQVKTETEALNAAVKTKSDALAAAEAAAAALTTEKDAVQQSLNQSQVAITDLQGQVAGLQKELAELRKTGQEKPGQAVPLPGSAAADQDKDGVADGIDLCADSPAGVAVNAMGCAEQAAIILEGVNFKTGTADLLPEARKNLDKAAASLKKATTITLEIAGYTDAVGDPARNQQLSARRAESVRQYFINKGIKAERLSTKGFGSDNPIADNATPEGRAKNRRVELHQKTH